MAPLAVDPAALDGAGSAVIGVGEGLGSVISTLTTALSGTGGMAGNDPAGAAFGRSYNSSASKLLTAMAVTRNGLCRIGDGVRMSAHNYSMAEAMSDVSGRADPLPVPPSTGSVSAGSSPSAVGSSTSTPVGWGWVAPYIGMIWPTGDPSKLRVAAAAWTSAGTNFEASEIASSVGPVASIHAQQLPEGPAMQAAFTDANHSAAAIVQQCASIAVQLNAYAAKIDAVHAAILDLLARICDPMTGLKEVWDILTRKDEDEIKKIANDIRTIVNNFTAEVDALRHQIAAAVSAATAVATTMAAYADKEWDQFLHGTDVGRAVNQVGQSGKGIGEEAGGLLKDNWTYGPLRAMVDPKGWYESWKDMVGGMAPLVGLGGDGAPGVGQAWKELGKGTIHWDEWSKNPAEAAGKSAFDVATLLVPGGAASKLGQLGRGARDAAEGLRKPPVLEPARPPHVEPPKPTPLVGAEPAPRGEPPSGGRPAPTPQPKPAPADSPPPHGPTESKAPVTERPTTGETPRPSAPASAPAPTEQRLRAVGTPSEHLPSTNSHPAGPAPAGVPVSAGGHTPQPAAIAPHAPQPAPSHAPPPPHAPIYDGSPPGGHLPEPPLHGETPGGRPFEPPPRDPGGPTSGGSGDAGDGYHGPAEGSAPGVRPDAPAPPPLPADHPLFEGYSPVEPGPEFTNADGSLIYPDHTLPSKPYAIPGTVIPDVRLPAGFEMGRFGYQGGAWMCPEGTPFSELSLPPDSALKPYFKYVVDDPAMLPPGWHVEQSKAAPWFHQSGGGTQYFILDENGEPGEVEKLVQFGFLRRVN